MECFLDLFDLDLELHLSLIDRAAHPIPLFASVYHDYHMTYGTYWTFNDTLTEAFRYAQAFGFVSGQQLMISGFYAGDDAADPRKRQYLEFLETLTAAHVAGRDWLNLGRWLPPPAVSGVTVPIKTGPERVRRVPAVVGGAFEHDGRVCVVLVNHTTTEQRFACDVAATAAAVKARQLRFRQTWPVAAGGAGSNVDPAAVTLPPLATCVLTAPVR
jgi:hypothetical protein